MTEPAWSAPMGAAYANSVNVAFSQWDFTLDFQLAAPPAPGAEAGAVSPTSVARVVMSPTHAKVVAELLSASVQGWEQRFGALPDAEILLPGLSDKLAEILAASSAQSPGQGRED